jgi:hypothetical protein
LLGLSYACLPMGLASLVKYTLLARGLSDVQVSVGYPEWRGIRLQKLQFTIIAGAQQYSCELTDADIEYHTMDLLTGTVERIRVPVAVAHIHPAPGVRPPVKTTAALPLAVLVSGQWLSQLPVRELSFEQLSVDWHTPSAAVYLFYLTGSVRDAEARLNGKVILPLPQQNQAAVTFLARKTGQAHLSVSSVDNPDEPILALAVNNVAIEQNQIKVNGMLNAKLATLVPMLQPWLTEMDWSSGLEGDFNSQWQAVLPTASPDEEGRLTLPPLHGGNSNWQVTGEARVHDLSGRWHEQLLPRGELYARFEADPHQGVVQTTLHAAEQAMVLETKIVHQFTTDHGHADLTLKPVMFSDTGFVLSQLLQDWPYPFDITAGRVSGSGRLVWQQAFDLHGIVQLDKLGGHYNRVDFAGLSGEIALTNGEGLRTSKDAQLRVDLVDVGFPVEKIDVRFALAPHSKKTVVPLVRVQQFSAQLLGGQARSGPFELDFGREKNTFVVQLQQIGLNEIMKLEQQQGLAGSGMLDGQVPVEITHDNIEVTQGKLSARAPGGAIRYVPTEKVSLLAKSNPSVKMIVDALSNFQYHILDVTSDYKPGGDLSLQVHLEGENPDWQSGQPIHLNLNLEENIPALLRSLQLSDEITNRVRKSYQKSR